MKQEIRVLGLDSCNRSCIFGVVTRGGLYLDGIFTMKNTESSVIARRVTKTKYFPELRTIMIHGPTTGLEPGVIERTTMLPVITIPIDHQVEGPGYNRIQVAGRRVSVRTGMDSKKLIEILSRTMVAGPLPEPVRIAHLLAKMSFLNPRLAG